MNNLETYSSKFKDLKSSFDEDFGFEDLNDLLCDVEVDMAFVDDMRTEEFAKLRTLKFEIEQFIENREKPKSHYDPEAELDIMFPDRHDDDFDEDSMSYDSVFGGD